MTGVRAASRVLRRPPFPLGTRPRDLEPAPAVPPQLTAAFLDVGDLVLGRVGIVALETRSTGGATDGEPHPDPPVGTTVDGRAISVSGAIPWSCAAAPTPSPAPRRRSRRRAAQSSPSPSWSRRAPRSAGGPPAVVSAAEAAAVSATADFRVVDTVSARASSPRAGSTSPTPGRRCSARDPALPGCLGHGGASRGRRRQQRLDHGGARHRGPRRCRPRGRASRSPATRRSASPGCTGPPTPRRRHGRDHRRGALAAPGGTAASITASHLELLGSRYLAYTDVTEAVQLGGAGVWSFGTAEVGAGAGAVAGWSLVVVVEDDALRPARRGVRRADGRQREQLPVLRAARRAGRRDRRRPSPGRATPGTRATGCSSTARRSRVWPRGDGRRLRLLRRRRDPACAPRARPRPRRNEPASASDTGVFAPGDGRVGAGRSRSVSPSGHGVPGRRLARHALRRLAPRSERSKTRGIASRTRPSLR